MSIVIDNIHKALKDKDITEHQALYLIFLSEDLPLSIDARGIKKLVELGFIHNNRISKKLYTHLDNTGELKGTIKAFYSNDISKQVVAKLARMFCMRDDKTGKVKLPGESGVDNPIHRTAEKYLGNEGFIAYHFVIFMYLFPVKSPFNRKWEKHFTGKEYKGPMLRIRSKDVGAKFIKSLKDGKKSKDMGALLYGTYLYISSCIQGTESYITTMPKFLKDHDEWYYIALELIENAKTVDELFKRRDLNKEGRVMIGL